MPANILLTATIRPSKAEDRSIFASLLDPDVVASKKTIYLGTILTPAFGGAGTGGSGGGGGPCFTGNTLVMVKTGMEHIQNVKPGMKVLTLNGWREVLALIEHDFDGEMFDMGRNEFVTPDHRFWHRYGWRKAEDIFFKQVHFAGKVFNLSIAGEGDNEHCYTLCNRWVAHNLRKI